MNNIIWISVDDQLPKSHERVLIVGYNPQNHYDRHISLAYFYGTDRVTGRRIWSGKHHVSYWARLPEMPKETDWEAKKRMNDHYEAIGLKR